MNTVDSPFLGDDKESTLAESLGPVSAVFSCHLAFGFEIGEKIVRIPPKFLPMPCCTEPNRLRYPAREYHNDLYFGPKAPASFEINWIETVPGKGFYPFFRLHSPKEGLFDGTWKLPDVELMK
jgi:hypothetical protein